MTFQTFWKKQAWQLTVLSFVVGSAVVLMESRAHAAGPDSVLPAGAAVKGWKQIGKTRLFNPDNIYDLVDGEGESIKQYAFLACAHAEYGPAAASKPSLTIDIYDMTNPLNAFGLFGSERTSGQPVAIGAEAVKIGQGGLNFWKGRYVVRTTITGRPDAPSQAAQTAYAKATAAKITGSTATPIGVQALPPGRKPRSEKYVMGNIAGHKFLKNAIVGDYPAVGQGAQLFIAEYPNPVGAKGALQQYQAYEKLGSGLKPLTGVGEAGFSVQDKYQKTVVVAQKGKYLVGVIRAKDAATATGLVKQAIAKVK